MVQTELIGGTGNNMFQYAIARIFADKKKYNLYVDNIYQLQQYFNNVVNITDRASYDNNVLHIGYNSPQRTVQYFNENEVEHHTGKINFSGFFQKFSYYKDNLELVKSIFSYDDKLHLKPGDDDIVIHIRLGDYIAMNWFVEPLMFMRIIERLDLTYTNCLIVTDDPNNLLFDDIKKFKNVHIINQTLIEDLTLIRHAKQLIISQSTLSWWGAILGNADKVYVPVSCSKLNYPWKLNPGLDDIDLIPTDDKYIKIEI